MTVKIIRGLLDKEQLDNIDLLIAETPWEDGSKTANAGAKKIKNNMQCTGLNPVLKKINTIIVNAIRNNNTIKNTFMPVEIVYPLLNKHTEGYFYGKHTDRAMRLKQKEGKYVRCDCTMVIFLSAADEYKGGNHVIYDNDAIHSHKLNKGDMLIYPTGYLHEVEMVTSGQRICSVSWMQCAIADAHERDMAADAFKLTSIVAQLTKDVNANGIAARLWNNLARKWSL